MEMNKYKMQEAKGLVDKLKMMADEMEMPLEHLIDMCCEEEEGQEMEMPEPHTEDMESPPMDKGPKKALLVALLQKKKMGK
jgi:hypothetical protein